MASGKQLEVSLILSAYDKASRVINNFATKNEAKLLAFSKKTSQLGDSAFGVGTKFGAMGLAAAGPLYLAAQAAEESEVATKRLNNVFKQMGDTTGLAAKQSAAYASALQLQIGVEDEVIMLTQAKIATFKHVSDAAARMSGVFDRATNAAFDMAAAGFGEAEQNAVQLGKALESPTQGINALRRSGITFTAEERKKIAVLEKSGQLLQAQKIILKAVEMQVKGASKATATQGQLTKIAYGEAMETLGRTFLPILNDTLKRVVLVINKIDAWIQRNPKLAQTIVYIVAGISALSLGISALSFVFGGVMKVMSAFSTVAKVLNSTLLANPIVLIVAAIVAAVALIIYNWDSIKAYFTNLWQSITAVFTNAWNRIKTFFSDLWEKIKAIFAKAWEFVKNIFLKYHPLGIIINNWDQIKQYFVNLWNNVTQRFTTFITFVKSIPAKMFEAGKNIVKSIWEGIKLFANKPVDAIKAIVKKIRDFLPFSPAKEGALKDIHRIRLIETISENIKPGPMVNAMRKTMAATFVATNAAVASPNVAVPIKSNNNISSGGITINYSPVINFSSGNADPATMTNFETMFQKHKREIVKIIEDHERNKKRVSY